MAIRWPRRSADPGDADWGRAIQDAIQAANDLAEAAKGAADLAGKAAAAGLSAVAKKTSLTAAAVSTMISNALSAAGVAPSYDMSKISTGNLDQARVVNTWTKDVSTTGDVNADSGLRSIGTYSRSLTTSFRSVSVTSVNGYLGFATSSARFKTNIRNAPVDDPRHVLKMVGRIFQYIQDVEDLGEEFAPFAWGLIAEEVDALGYHWLVEYDEEGKPFGVNYDRVALAFLPFMVDIDKRVTALETGEND